MNFTAPIFEGKYRGNWQIRNNNSEIFGTTATAKIRYLWIVVKAHQCLVAYDAQQMPVPPMDKRRGIECGEPRCDGFVLRQSIARLEMVRQGRSNVTFPQNTFNGYIRGVYPSFKVQSGDHFRAIVNCERGATSCGVLFRVDYQLADGIIRDFWAFGEQYEGSTFAVDLDLSPLAGQNVKFVLTVLSLGSATGDRALWVEPRIVRTAPAVTITPTP
jgi:hypothetical protein